MPSNILKNLSAPAGGNRLKAAAGRLDHVDAAKGVSILLVVYWHAVDNRLLINEALWMLRMPLFFFVSGLFAVRTLSEPWEKFLPNKVGNILYLYIIWTILMFSLTNFVAQYLDGRPIAWHRPLNMFTDPPRTLWFMYALAIAYFLAKPLRLLPKLPVLIGLLALYSWSISSGDWRVVPFPEKIMRLFPFFYLALYISKPFLEFIDKYSKWGYAALPLFVAAALLVFETTAAQVGPLTFLISMLGVVGVLMLAREWQGHPLTAAMVFIGKRSLFVYVIHRIPLFYLTNAMDVLDIDRNALSMSIVAFLTAGICLALGELFLKFGPSLLYDAPWLSKREGLKARLAK